MKILDEDYKTKSGLSTLESLWADNAKRIIKSKSLRLWKKEKG